MKLTCKPFILLTILITVAEVSFAQVQWGVRAGANFTNVNSKFLNSKIDTESRTGLQLGVTFNIPLINNFYIQSGLLYSEKGYKTDRMTDQSGNLIPMLDISPTYLEIPINFLYKPVLGSGKLLLGAGPYLAYGISGKYKGGEISQNINWGASSGYKTFDAGAGALAGYEFNNKISFQVNAQMGLISTIRNSDIHKVKNQVLTLSLGYTFN